MADKKSDDQSAVWESEKKLDNEEKTLIGNEAEDRNLTGSTTYVTLPDQGDQQSGQNSGKNSGKGNQQSQTSGDQSSDKNRGDKRS